VESWFVICDGVGIARRWHSTTPRPASQPMPELSDRHRWPTGLSLMEILWAWLKVQIGPEG
jgi:hypothetical protein